LVVNNSALLGGGFCGTWYTGRGRGPAQRSSSAGVLDTKNQKIPTTENQQPAGITSTITLPRHGMCVSKIFTERCFEPFLRSSGWLFQNNHMI